MRPKLNDPELVRREYEDESRFSVRQATWGMATGPDAQGMVVDALATIAAQRVLEVDSARASSRSDWPASSVPRSWPSTSRSAWSS